MDELSSKIVIRPEMVGYIDYLNLAVSIADFSENKFVIRRIIVSPVIVQCVSKTQLFLIHPQTKVSVVVRLRCGGHHDWRGSTGCASKYKLTEMDAIAIVRHHACAQDVLGCKQVLVETHAADDCNIIICVVGATRCIHIVPCHCTIAHSGFA